MRNINLKYLDYRSGYEQNNESEENLSNILKTNRSRNTSKHTNKCITPTINYKIKPKLKLTKTKSRQLINIAPLELKNIDNKTNSTIESNKYVKMIQTKTIDKYLEKKEKNRIENYNKNFSSIKLSTKKTNYSNFKNNNKRLKIKKKSSIMQSIVDTINKPSKFSEIKIIKKNEKKMGTFT